MPKQINISLWELSKQGAAKLPDGTQVLIYNPMTSYYKIETIGKGCLARDKHAYEKLKYFSFEEVKNDP